MHADTALPLFELVQGRFAGQSVMFLFTYNRCMLRKVECHEGKTCGEEEERVERVKTLFFSFFSQNLSIIFFLL
jgi:hypothetical protein